MKRPAALALFGLLSTGILAMGVIACGPPPAKNTAKKVGKDDRPEGSSGSMAEIKFQESPANGDPATVGCADGQREGFADLTKFPTIAGCLASWEGDQSLRKGPMGAPCGDDLEACTAPASACATGWHVCARDGNYKDIVERIDAKACSEGAGPGRFNAAISHVKKKKECAPPPTDTTRYPCLKDGYGSEPVCCGLDCRFGQCRDAVWEKETRISVGKAQGCGHVGSEKNGGVMCCKDKEKPTVAPIPAVPLDGAPVDGTPTALEPAAPAEKTGVDSEKSVDDKKSDDKKSDDKKSDDEKTP